MKKGQFIETLSQAQPGDTRVLGFLVFKGQDNEAIRQLKSILKHPKVFNLADEAPLPDEAMDAIKKVIEDANNVDAQTKMILDTLRSRLPSAATDAEAVSSSSSNSVAAAPEGVPYFQGVPRLPMECLFDWLPPKDQFRFFVALGKTKHESYKQAREAAVESVSEHFLQLVADAKMKEAEEMLKFVQFNPAMLRQLLTTNRECTHLCRMPIRGTALEIAEKCWDTAINKQEAMAEMIMRYMRKLEEVPETENRAGVRLPSGEELISQTQQKLYPNGKEAHRKAQEARAEQFATEILEPLATTIKTASPQDIALVYDLTEKDGKEYDNYIKTTLANNGFWKKLVAHREAISTFMREDKTYNPFYLQKAIACADEKYEKEQWGDNMVDGYDRLALLSIRGIGRIQACGPVLVTMLFARGALWDFYDKKDDPAALDAFKVERKIEFKYGGGDASRTSHAGDLLLGEKYWLARDGTCAGAGGGWLWVSVSGGLDFYVKQKTRDRASTSINQHHTSNERMCNAVISCPNELAMTKRNC